MLYTASKKRRPDHLRPRTGYVGNPNSVFRTPTPCNDTLRQTTNGARLGKSFASPRIPCSLIWRLPLRVAERVDVGIYVKCTNKRELVISVSAYSTLPAADAAHMSVEITMVTSSAQPLITIVANPRCLHLRFHAHATRGSKWQCWLIVRRLGRFSASK